MDKVKVNIDSLNAANTALKELLENLSGAISKCATDLKNNFNGIDDSYKKDITEYIAKLNSFQHDLATFESENNKAIKERITRISDYSKTTYKRRNIQ